MFISRNRHRTIIAEYLEDGLLRRIQTQIYKVIYIFSEYAKTASVRLRRRKTVLGTHRCTSVHRGNTLWAPAFPYRYVWLTGMGESQRPSVRIRTKRPTFFSQYSYSFDVGNLHTYYFRPILFRYTRPPSIKVPRSRVRVRRGTGGSNGWFVFSNRTSGRTNKADRRGRP